MKQTNHISPTSGFSLVEISIVVVIILTFSTLTLTWYRSFSQKSDLNRNVQKFADVVTLVQKEAKNGVGSNACVGANVYQGKRILLTSSQLYEVQVCCGTSTTSYTCTTENQTKLTNLVTVTSPSPGAEFFFSSGSNTSVISTQPDVIFKHGSSGQCVKVTMTESEVSPGTEYDCSP